MADVCFRPIEETDYAPLSEIIDEEWKFGIYSKRNDRVMAECFLSMCVDGANVAETMLVNGKPSGVLVMADMPGGRIDISAHLESLLEQLWDDPGYGHFLEDMDELHRFYGDFAALYKKPDWAELRLLIVTKSCKGMGLGRMMVDEARRVAEHRGIQGVFFYTDTDCNFAFYDHLGAVRVGERTVMCLGEPMRAFCYYLQFR